MAESLPQILSDLQSQIDDLSAGLVAVPRGPGSIKNGMIAPNSVQATNINVQKLAAVSSQTGSLSVTGSLTMTASGVFSAGQTAYNTGVGWWLEGNSGTPRFSLGNSSAQHLTWDGTTLAITGVLTLDSGGVYGDTIKWVSGGSDAGSIWASSTALVIQEGPASPGTGGSLSLDNNGFTLFHSNGSVGVGAAAMVVRRDTAGPALFLNSTGTVTVHTGTNNNNIHTFDTTGGLTIAGAFFPSGQASRGISDNGFQTAFSGGIKLGGTILMGSGNTGTSGSGALPSPTKWIEFLDSSGNPYIVPAYSQNNPWTA